MEKSKFEKLKLLITESISYRKKHAETVDETFQMGKVSRMNSSKYAPSVLFGIFLLCMVFYSGVATGSKNRFGASTQWF